MAVEKAKAYLKQFDADTKVVELTQSSATVELAAAAIGCETDRIAKSVSLLQGEEAVIIVVSGDSKIDNKKYKQHFGVKAKMIPFEEVEGYIGHAPGGVCPFGVNEGVKVYLDESLKAYDTVFPAAGSSNSMIELTMAELERFSASLAWVDVCKKPEPAVEV